MGLEDELMRDAQDSVEEVVTACVEMARFAEDQFTCWNSPLDVANEGKMDAIPFVYEQFDFQVPVDHSTAGVAMAWMRVSILSSTSVRRLLPMLHGR